MMLAFVVYHTTQLTQTARPHTLEAKHINIYVYKKKKSNVVLKLRGGALIYMSQLPADYW